MNVRAAGEKDLESVLALYAHLFPEESYDDACAYRCGAKARKAESTPRLLPN